MLLMKINHWKQFHMLKFFPPSCKLNLSDNIPINDFTVHLVYVNVPVCAWILMNEAIYYFISFLFSDSMFLTHDISVTSRIWLLETHTALLTMFWCCQVQFLPYCGTEIGLQRAWWQKQWNGHWRDPLPKVLALTMHFDCALGSTIEVFTPFLCKPILVLIAWILLY